jgi:drug/metabolite transporter (DMT)-like permease
MTQQNRSGYFYAFGAALALSASFVFSKSVLNQVSMIQFGFVWFMLGVIWNSAWYISQKQYKQFKINTRQRLIVAVSIAILEAAATGLFYIAIRAMENPAVVSFIGNIGPVFVTILGVSLLKERFGRRQVVGISVTIIGIFVINFKGQAFGGFLEPGAIYVIFASLLFAVATITGRKYNKHLDPGLMSLIRSIILAVVFTVLILNSNEAIKFEWPVWRDMAIGSIFETLLTIVFAYQALKRIEATSTSLIIGSKGVWTLILAWIFLGVFPTGMQLVGGVLTLLGVMLITAKPPIRSRE